MKVHVVYDEGVADTSFGYEGHIEAVYAEDRKDVADRYAEATSLSVTTMEVQTDLPEWVEGILRDKGLPHRRTASGRWRK